MSEQIKFCKDCRWCKPDRGWAWFFPFLSQQALRAQWIYARCLRPKSDISPEYLVSGIKPKHNDLYADIERRYGNIGCGPDAKYFEARP